MDHTRWLYWPYDWSIASQFVLLDWWKEITIMSYYMTEYAACEFCKATVRKYGKTCVPFLLLLAVEYRWTQAELYLISLGR